MDYYKLLGVARTATTAEIDVAYRRLAVECHPDLNHSLEAVELFKRLVEAADTLRNPNKRVVYDRAHPEPRKKKDPKKDKPRDPNFGRWTTPPPPKFDIWGQPLSKEEQEEWFRTSRETMEQTVGRRVRKPPPLPDFIDAYSSFYESGGQPDVRG